MHASTTNATNAVARPSLFARLARLIERLNAHIDSCPMPTGRRLGAWEIHSLPQCERPSQEP